MHASLRANKRRLELPDSFVSIGDILNRRHRVGSLVNVVGIVRDFLEPIATRGADWKCQIKLCDRLSGEGIWEGEGVGEDGRITIYVFRPQEEMPDVVLGDVVVLFQAKIQQLHSDSLSLVTNHATDIHVYSADKIPPPPSNAIGALKPSRRKVIRKPGQTENAFISSRFHTARNPHHALPGPQSEAETETKQFQSKKPGRKFKMLKELDDRVFADMTVQLVKRPYDSGDIITIWVSDYTENSHFYNFAFKGLSLDNPYGYNTGAQVVDERGTEWPGPYGKMSLQITVFEPHASVIRKRKMEAGDWVHLRNVQIKYGNNGSNLEGFLREDRNSLPRKVNVYSIDHPGDSDSIDPDLKEALRRKRDYERAKKKQLNDLLDAAQAGKKRKSDLAELDDPKTNAKERRMAKRAQKQRAKEVHETTRTEAETPILNPQVKCDHQNKPTSSVEDVLKSISHQTIVEGEELQLALPFINANYRINARVVNFLPSRLEEFAYPKKRSEYSGLSDHESDSSDSELEDSRTQISRPHHWEWRFFLELEDAAAPVVAKSKNEDREKQNGEKKKKDTVWVAVDNQSAQCLLDLDASDLKNEPQKLEALRQRLFLLWGELEEHKARESEATERRMKRSAQSNSPPAHSSDDEGTSHHETTTKSTTTQVINRPFACCIRQYGIKVPESDPCKADAGDGNRWQRMFGLFGTRISS